MSDAAPATAHRPSSRGLRLFDALLRILTVLLMLATLVAVPLGVLMLAGTTATFAVPATVEPPYSMELDGLSIDVHANGDSYQEGEVEPDGSRLLSTRIHTELYPGEDDTDARLVVAATGLMWLLLAWVGLVNLRRVVRSARAGDPFEARNVLRLRWLAGAVLAFPVVAAVMAQVMEKTLDVEPAVDVATWGPSWWIFLAIGVGLLALAEVFREGAALRELERATI